MQDAVHVVEDVVLVDLAADRSAVQGQDLVGDVVDPPIPPLVDLPIVGEVQSAVVGARFQIGPTRKNWPPSEP